eukprot:TRINITY_DN1806_c1_g1_i2.p1 TRINITY_DN1806_c1_g1~~TRINITY_DN1806_c1_g1_i2.p1  ORF type:complete len:284 (-),score=30.43 TRINITY_DN1806_c1_g1_i2:137-988(-)
MFIFLAIADRIKEPPRRGDKLNVQTTLGHVALVTAFVRIKLDQIASGIRHKRRGNDNGWYDRWRWEVFKLQPLMPKTLTPCRGLILSDCNDPSRLNLEYPPVPINSIRTRVVPTRQQTGAEAGATASVAEGFAAAAGGASAADGASAAVGAVEAGAEGIGAAVTAGGAAGGAQAGGRPTSRCWVRLLRMAQSLAVALHDALRYVSSFMWSPCWCACWPVLWRVWRAVGLCLCWVLRSSSSCALCWRGAHGPAGASLEVSCDSLPFVVFFAYFPLRSGPCHMWA